MRKKTKQKHTESNRNERIQVTSTFVWNLFTFHVCRHTPIPNLRLSRRSSEVSRVVEVPSKKRRNKPLSMAASPSLDFLSVSFVQHLCCFIRRIVLVSRCARFSVLRSHRAFHRRSFVRSLRVSRSRWWWWSSSRNCCASLFARSIYSCFSFIGRAQIHILRCSLCCFPALFYALHIVGASKCAAHFLSSSSITSSSCFTRIFFNSLCESFTCSTRRRRWWNEKPHRAANA